MFAILQITPLHQARDTDTQLAQHLTLLYLRLTICRGNGLEERTVDTSRKASSEMISPIFSIFPWRSTCDEETELAVVQRGYTRQPLTPAKVTERHKLTFMFFMVHSKEKGSTTERLRRSSCAHKHGQRVEWKRVEKDE